MNTTPLRTMALGTLNDDGSVTGVSADEAMGAPINVAVYPQITIFLTSVGTTTSGVITIEEADYDPSRQGIYGGTWSSITTKNANDFTGGATLAYHLTAPSAYAWIRVRVSTAIGGGGTVYAALRAT